MAKIGVIVRVDRNSRGGHVVGVRDVPGGREVAFRASDGVRDNCNVVALAICGRSEGHNEGPWADKVDTLSVSPP